MAKHDDPAPATASGKASFFLVATAVLAVASSLVGRALAPALPGSLSGITTWIRAFGWLSGLLAQLFAFSGILVAVRLMGAALRTGQLDLLFKLIALPVTILIGFLVMTRMRIDYSEPRSSLAFALASGSLAVAAAPRLVQTARTRAMGMVLALSGLSGLLHAIAQGLALEANLEAAPDRFALARLVETGSFAIGVGAVALACAWMFGLRRRGLVQLALALGVALLLTQAAVRGSGPQASLPEVLASRSLGFLLRDPAPFLPDFARSVVVLFELLLSALALCAWQPSRTRQVFCLCLVGLGSTDIPLSALALTLAALVARAPDEEAAPTSAATARLAKRDDAAE